MQSWVIEAIQCPWTAWEYEEMIKAKGLFLDYLGHAFARRGEEEGRRFAEHLEAFGGEEQAMLFAGERMVPAPTAALGNAMLTDRPLLFPVVLAAIEQQNKGGQELLAALIAGLETRYRMGQHEHADLLGALVGAAHAFELDEDGWEVLLGLFLRDPRGAQETAVARGLLAHDIVLSAGLARDEWSEGAVPRMSLPVDWREQLERSSDKPGLKLFLMATEVNYDQVAAQFRERAAGKVPDAHIEYYIDAVMGFEDICCVPLFFRR